MDGASNYYLSYGNGVPSMAVNRNGSVTQVDYSYNKFHNTNVGYDSSGNIYAVATNTDRINDTSAKFAFYSRAVARDNSIWYTSSWTGKRLLETVYNNSTGVYDIGRVPIPKLVVRGTTAATQVYMSYNFV